MQALSRSTMVVGIMIAFVAVCGVRLRADDGEKPDSPTSELISILVQVTTEDDEPIEGAIVRRHGLRTVVERGTSYVWDPKSHGSHEDLLTDVDGNVEITYPKYVKERFETGEVSLLVNHENFISVAQDSSVRKGVIRVKMERGNRYFVRALDASTKEVIVQNVYCELSGDAGSNEWKLLKDGTLRSHAVAAERDFLRVVYLPADGAAMFSSPVYLGNHVTSIVGRRLPDVLVKRGRQIHGRLDDTVPRPVKNGHVILIATSAISGKDESRLTWNDWTAIDADGKFHFESVPPETIVMVVAVCDGYLSAAATLDELEAAGIRGEEAAAFTSQNRVVPMVKRSKSDVSDWTLPMLPTASCRVTVLAPDGTPLPGAEVSAWPNQYFPGLGSSVIGDGYRSAKRHKLTEEQLKQLWSWTQQDEMKKLGVLMNFRQAYTQKTDKKGIAVLHTLPGGQAAAIQQRLLVDHPDYEVPDSPDQPLRRFVMVPLLAEETAEVTVRMQPKGIEISGHDATN